MTPGIVIKVFKTCADMIGETVLNACASRPRAVGYDRIGRRCREIWPWLASDPTCRPVDQTRSEGHAAAAASSCKPRHFVRIRQHAGSQRLILCGGVIVGLLAPNDRAGLAVRANLSAADESWNGIAGRTTHATAGIRSGIPVKSVSGVQSEIEAAPVIGFRCDSGRKVIIVAIFSPLIVSGIAVIADTRVCAFLETDEVTAARAVLRREYSDPGAASDLIDRMN